MASNWFRHTPHLSHFFFFSSRRRHTRWTGDWSSDVCSSDLLADDGQNAFGERANARGDNRIGRHGEWQAIDDDARSEERREGKSVDLGGRGIIKKKNTKE